MFAKRILLPALCSLLLATPASGARIYQLVNYPDIQNGHTLTGTITTTDDAPDDSILDVGEILGWEWSISGPNEFSASSVDFVADRTTATRVVISPTAIQLPLTTAVIMDPAVLELSRTTLLGPGGRGTNNHELGWATYFDSESGALSNYHAGRLLGDATEAYWSGAELPTNGASIIVAIAIPEPSSTHLIAPLLIWLIGQICHRT